MLSWASSQLQDVGVNPEVDRCGHDRKLMASLPAADVRADPAAAGAPATIDSGGLPLDWQAVFNTWEIHEVYGAVCSFVV